MNREASKLGIKPESAATKSKPYADIWEAQRNTGDKWPLSKFSQYASGRVAGSFARMDEDPLRKDKRFHLAQKPVPDGTPSPAVAHMDALMTSSASTNRVSNLRSSRLALQRARKSNAARILKGRSSKRASSSGARHMQINEPLRVDLKVLQARIHGNWPERRAVQSMDAQKLSSTFSPQVLQPRSRRRRRTAPIITDDVQTQRTRKMMRDARTLATACRRAGKEEQEATAHFRMGVLHDNLSQFAEAIQSYQQYMQICRKHEDRPGEALACNCIGVNHHLLARRLDSRTDAKGKKGREWHLSEAMRHHREHLELARDDQNGQFIAHSNLGLVASVIGDSTTAVTHHQLALKLAMLSQDALKQSTAVGNLGVQAKLDGDLGTAMHCMQERLQLVGQAQDLKAESQTLQELGGYAMQSGDFASASDLFAQAKDLAEASGVSGLSKSAKCQFGVAKGKMLLQERMAQLAASLGGK